MARKLLLLIFTQLLTGLSHSFSTTMDNFVKQAMSAHQMAPKAAQEAVAKLREAHTDLAAAVVECKTCRTRARRMKWADIPKKKGTEYILDLSHEAEEATGITPMSAGQKASSHAAQQKWREQREHKEQFEKAVKEDHTRLDAEVLATRRMEYDHITRNPGSPPPPFVDSSSVNAALTKEKEKVVDGDLFLSRSSGTIYIVVIVVSCIGWMVCIVATIRGR
ncbi:hypothetical protein CYMTET_13470 [Cymbomonas tetramitiformis]|uniref:Uncharacterized protein n=1 Tax=Cymbomonas tetramitiformis TaxID=36881 RepID=A0AAE0GI37_9CHLO|nr:hypothetical protein CYMTET_13470 [Cymbomonas tetramitiformis]